MDRTLTLAPAASNGGIVPSPSRRGPRLRRWGASGKVDPIATAAALELGLTPKAAEHAMKQAFHRVAVYAKHFIALGDHVRLVALLAELDRVLLGFGGTMSWREVLALSSQEEAVDGEESAAQMRMQACNTPETRHAFVRRAREEMAVLQRLIAGVEAQDAVPGTP